jgi:peptidoglycan/xylan/chitin deacetylase (PgdA/CDA1 family)
MNWVAISLAGAGAAGIASWAAVSPASRIFGPVLRRVDSPSALALTFDDGPNPAFTPALLDLFERYHVRASFFMIGRHVRAYPALAAEIAGRGHAIGNHTDSHPNLLWLSGARIRDELDRCQESIFQATGSRPGWMRPPFGFRGPQLAPVVRRGGWRGVALWSRILFDWKPLPAGPVIRRLARARGGDIVLMHDGHHVVGDADRSHVVRALEYWVPRWVDAGLGFVTIDELPGAPRPAGAS